MNYKPLFFILSIFFAGFFTRDSFSAQANALRKGERKLPIQVDDPLFRVQWALSNSGQIISPLPNPKTGPSGKRNADIRASSAWALQTDCSSVLVGVMDTGIDFSHDELTSNVKLEMGTNTLNPGSDFFDQLGHGTHVSGIIGALGNNKLGISGICWKASIVPIKVCDDQGGCPESSILEGFAYAESLASRGLRVVNTSLGGFYPIQFNLDDPDDRWLADELSQQAQAIRRMDQAGILLAAAAGNNLWNNDDSMYRVFPASHPIPNVISVAATDPRDRLDANYSNYGPTTVHIAAPGSLIFSTLPAYIYGRPTGGYGLLTGTSMATPHVTAAVALLMSYRPSLTHIEVKSAILKFSDRLANLKGKVISGARLNLHRVLQYADSIQK